MNTILNESFVMRSKLRIQRGRFLVLLGVLIPVFQIDAQQQESATVPVYRAVQDPAVPMIALPSRFASHRANCDGPIPESGTIDLANLQGPGCIRHLWILYGDDIRLEINVDGAAVSQIDVPLKPFFGVMHGLDPYFVNSAAFTVLPNPVFGKDGHPGYNLFLPIPFQKSCRITIHGPAGRGAVAMVDWQKYDSPLSLTPYRLHADHRLYQPAPERGSYVELAETEGEGFVAGIVIGYIQRNKRDMVFHTGGMTLLLDGETDPHVIRGHNVEDDFGFTWGFNDRQSRWIGCPWHENRGRNDQDGVFYRFFGPDPIAFRSSLVFRTGCRGDDMESVVYTYRIPDTSAPEIQSPGLWQGTGLFIPEPWEAFADSPYVSDKLPVAQWPAEPDRHYPTQDQFQIVTAKLESKRGWIDLQNVYFHRHHTATPLTMLDRSVYARTYFQSSETRQGILRLAVDDWAVVWLNGRKIAALRHDKGLKTVYLPVTILEGKNELLIKSINTDTPRNKGLWTIHCVVQ